MKHTVIVNLYGGPGSGKSTTAAGIFHELKTAGKNAELIQEHAKEWAWEGRAIGKFDQIALLAEQLKRETRLVGKVDYIITDSPSLLCAFYENYYHKTETTLPIIQAAKTDRAAKVMELHFYLPDTSRHIQEGRYETKEQAATLHDALEGWLYGKGIPLIKLKERNPKALSTLLQDLQAVRRL